MKKLFNKLPQKVRIFIIFVLILTGILALFTLPLWANLKVILVGFTIFALGTVAFGVWMIAKSIVEDWDKRNASTKG